MDSLYISTKNTGDTLTATEYNQTVSKINELVEAENSDDAKITKGLADVSTAVTNCNDATSTANTNESTRQANETARVNAEKDRDSAETSRKSAESDRASSENTRVSSEATRVTNESSRISNETSRVSAEKDRVSAESTRSTNESTRTTSETSRVNAEKDRVSAETSRSDSEKTRVSNETVRQSNEDTRKSNETARVSAEDSRKTAESTRETNTATAITNCNTAAASANNAATNANNPPKIADGYWALYDKTTAAYVTTSYPATGKSPYISDGNTWMLWDDTTQKYVDSGRSINSAYELTKAAVENVLTGDITSHNHDNEYLAKTGNAASATKLATARKITIGSKENTFDGSADISYTIADIGAAAESHKHTKSDITDFPTSLPASDVSDWAKATSKPTYNFSEIGSLPTTLAGYGITDAAKTGSLATFSGLLVNNTSATPQIILKGSTNGYLGVNTGSVIYMLELSTTLKWRGFTVLDEDNFGTYAAAASHTHTVSQITDFPTSLPASDVSSWAKASAKPSYSYSEITGTPTIPSKTSDLTNDSNFVVDANYVHTDNNLTDTLLSQIGQGGITSNNILGATSVSVSSDTNTSLPLTENYNSNYIYVLMFTYNSYSYQLMFSGGNVDNQYVTVHSQYGYTNSFMVITPSTTNSITIKFGYSLTVTSLIRIK